MKHFSFIIPIMAAVFISCTETPVLKSDKEKDNLKGMVKSVMTASFKAIDKFGEGTLTKGEPNSIGYIYTEYDTLGFYKEQLDYSLNKTKIRATHFYDENYRNYKYEYYNDGDDTKISFGSESTYDNKGTEIEEKDLSNGKSYKYQTQYDNDGQLVFYKDRYTKNHYKYKNNNLIQHIEIDNVFERIVTHIYEYDNNGNKVKEIRSFDDGDKYYFFTKYDQFNRIIDSYRTEVDNPTTNDIQQRTKYYYENDSTKEAYLTRSWNNKGEIDLETQKIWFTNLNDTTTVIEIDKKKNNRITRIYDVIKDGGNKIEKFYLTEGEIYYSSKYYYNDGYLASMVSSEGYKQEYKYNDKGELNEVEGTYTDTKHIDTYVKNKRMSSISYDKDGNITRTFHYTYKREGDVEICIETFKIKDRERVTQKFYKNEKLIKLIDSDSSVTEYFYNENGDEICEKNNEGKILKFVYEYDSNGNWIKKISYKDDTPYDITERAITYY